MSDFTSKLEPCRVTEGTRARAYLDQIEKTMWGRVEVLDADELGPKRVKKVGMGESLWKRVAKDKRGMLFETEAA